MRTTLFENLRRRLFPDRKTLGADFTAGLTTGIASIPDSMASALLAGVNPLTGLYTMIGVLDRYARTLQGNGGKVMLVGVSESAFAQLERTGLLELIGRDNVVKAQAQWGAAANQALEAAQAWLDAIDRPAKGTA